MSIGLTRIILYVHDVERLSAFYREAFGLTVVEHIADEWAVLAAGACEIALHRVGQAYRTSDPGASQGASNAKLVLSIDGDIAALRATLAAKGVRLGDIKSYPGTGRLCDGRDPEGNVFQLAEPPAPGFTGTS
jgi:predicted enzyme related to lactoylglutathione lyase